MGSLGTAIEACIAGHELRVVLDLGKVTLLSSQALAQLLACSARLAGLGGWLRLNAPNPLRERFPMVPSWQKAVAV